MCLWVREGASGRPRWGEGGTGKQRRIYGRRNYFKCARLVISRGSASRVTPLVVSTIGHHAFIERTRVAHRSANCLNIVRGISDSRCTSTSGDLDVGEMNAFYRPCVGYIGSNSHRLYVSDA